MGRYVVVICFSLLFAAAVSTSPKKYRNDYEYNQNTDSFYKFHAYETRQADAKWRCEREGAHLVHPGSAEDLVQVHAMMKRFPDLGPHVWLSNDPFMLSQDSVEEKTIVDLSPSQLVTEEEPDMLSPSPSQCDVMSRRGTVESAYCYQQLPFACKVAAKDVAYDSQCRVYSNRYNYSSALGSCYQLSQYSDYTWNEAYAECQAEGSHLAVLNSVSESLYLKDLFQTRRATRVTRSLPSFYAIYRSPTYFGFVGIRADRPTNGTERIFRTVLNTTLEEAGFAEWSDGEPNNYLDSEYCGSIFANNGKYNDVDCNAKYSFLCEVEVP